MNGAQEWLYHPSYHYDDDKINKDLADLAQKFNALVVRIFKSISDDGRLKPNSVGFESLTPELNRALKALTFEDATYYTIDQNGWHQKVGDVDLIPNIFNILYEDSNRNYTYYDVDGFIANQPENYYSALAMLAEMVRKELDTIHQCLDEDKMIQGVFFDADGSPQYHTAPFNIEDLKQRIGALEEAIKNGVASSGGAGNDDDLKKLRAQIIAGEKIFNNFLIVGDSIRALMRDKSQCISYAENQDLTIDQQAQAVKNLGLEPWLVTSPLKMSDDIKLLMDDKTANDDAMREIGIQLDEASGAFLQDKERLDEFLKPFDFKPLAYIKGCILFIEDYLKEKNANAPAEEQVAEDEVSNLEPLASILEEVQKIEAFVMDSTGGTGVFVGNLINIEKGGLSTTFGGYGGIPEGAAIPSYDATAEEKEAFCTSTLAYVQKWTYFIDGLKKNVLLNTRDKWERLTKFEETYGKSFYGYFTFLMREIEPLISDNHNLKTTNNRLTQEVDALKQRLSAIENSINS